MGERVDSVAPPARSWPHDARHIARHSCSALLRVPPPLPLSCSVAPGFAPLVCTLVLPGFWWVCCLAGLGGGGALDAGSGPSLREFPHGGADACTPR